MARTRTPALGFIFVTLLLIVLGFGIIIPVLPGLVTEFKGNNLSDGSIWYGVLVAAFSVMQFVSAPILGALSDRYGRRRVILIALAGSAIDYVIMGFAPNLGWLFVARVISGMTAGAFATCYAYIADVTPPERRAAGFGIVGAAFGVGLVIGPALGGYLGHVSLRLPFFVSAGCVALNWLYGAFVLPESLPLEKRRAFSWSRANPVGSLLALRRFRGVMDLAGVHFIYMFGQVIMQSTWVLFMGYRFHWGLDKVGLSLTVAGVGAAVVQGRLVRPIISRIGERRGLILGLSLVCVTFVGYGVVPWAWAIYPVILVGSFGGIAGPATQSLVTRHVPADEQGAVQGSLAGLQSLASILAPLLATWSFGVCVKDGALLPLPGIPFFEGALLTLVAIVLARASFVADDALGARTAPAAH